MAVILVTYDLKTPGKKYDPVIEYLGSFNKCKHLESVWLLDTDKAVEVIRNNLDQRVDSNDVVLVVQITRNFASLRYGCEAWLKSPERSW